MIYIQSSLKHSINIMISVIFDDLMLSSRQVISGSGIKFFEF